ncbi:MAG: dipeptidyl peptidase 3, partial [Flavobacteriales bacterium]|nr:dipeptidyl peptidase 3 [Flavobacteriales bacterium]
MKFKFLLPLSAALFLAACTPEPETDEAADQAEASAASAKDDFNYLAEQFADVKVLRYRIPAWDKLPLDQKKLAYYLAEAGYAGRDMTYDQNYRHNLEIRHALEGVYQGYEGDKSTEDWKAFDLYLKRMWFANGIHHHYSGDKKQAEVELFYKAKRKNVDPDRPISIGLNARLVKDEDGKIYEDVYKVDGLYGGALSQTVSWLEKAVDVAGNPQQKEALELLIEYYRTGDLETWDAYNIAWVKDTSPTVDYIQGFVEVYEDPLGYSGSYESIVQVRDLDASEKMKVLADNAQYFEENSSTLPEHKKEKVTGITYNFINVVAESGDASPSTPVGVNLPNATWIRAE